LLREQQLLLQGSVSSAQEQQQQQQQLDATAQPPAPPPWVHRQGTPEYFMPEHTVCAAASGNAPSIAAAAAAAAAVPTATRGPGRRLAQLPPQYCGKLGTYVPNYYSNVDGSMFGVSVSPNADGSVIGVGAPINGPDPKQAGAASVLTSWSDATCEYAVAPLWQPEGCYKYYGAQVGGLLGLLLPLLGTGRV
jgi:hypothetical protein